MNDFKTIAEIAANIGVSRQAVYLKLKNNDLSNAVKPFTERQGKVTRYSIKGVELIKEAFANNPVSCEIKNLTDDLKDSQEKCQELSSDLQNRQDELEKTVKEVKQLQDNIKVLENEKAELMRKTSELDSLTSKCQELEKICEVLKTKLSEKENFILDKTKAVDDLKASNEKLNERLDKAENDRTELIAANKELTIALKAAQALHGMDKQTKTIEATTMEQPESEPQPKRGFFKRLFGKRS